MVDGWLLIDHHWWLRWWIMVNQVWFSWLRMVKCTEDLMDDVYGNLRIMPWILFVASTAKTNRYEYHDPRIGDLVTKAIRQLWCAPKHIVWPQSLDIYVCIYIYIHIHIERKLRSTPQVLYHRPAKGHGFGLLWRSSQPHRGGISGSESGRFRHNLRLGLTHHRSCKVEL